MKRTTLRPFLAIAILAAPLAHAASVGWNYVGVSGVSLAASDTAGAGGFAQDNWNNHAGIGQGPGTVPLNDLIDSAGDPTSLDVTGWSLSANNSWQHGQTGNANEILMNDFNNKEPILTFEQIPYALYDVVVYYGNNEGPSTSTLAVGSQSRTITTGNTAQSSYGAVGFVEGTDANTADPTNYSVFTGLTASSLSVSLTTNNNNGISAIQFVDAIPEPASTSLLGLGLILTFFRRRR